MKLYLLSQDDNSDYDTYDSCVVAAESEGTARAITPEQSGTWGARWSAWASSPDKVEVKYIGEAKEGTESGVILASFNAG